MVIALLPAALPAALTPAPARPMLSMPGMVMLGTLRSILPTAPAPARSASAVMSYRTPPTRASPWPATAPPICSIVAAAVTVSAA
jgi:hypothetical protein